MRLTDEERALLAGERGRARQWALRHQIAVGEFFDAADFVPVAQAHIMADTESLGEEGVRWLEQMMALPAEECRVLVPTITDPRGVDFDSYKRLKQTDAMADIEARAIRAFEALGVLMTNTCINYQTILPPVRGEHLAMGDTGVVIYSNSVFGARSNFEGGPSALAAGLTGRTPRYGYHLDECRPPTRRFRLATTPRDLSEWGALGGLAGRACGSFWEGPLIEGIAAPPGSDALKHFGAALASYGSVALFHMPGITADDITPDRRHPAGTPAGGRQSIEITRAEIQAFVDSHGATGDKVDVVAFAAPQLSLIEMAEVADALSGHQIHPETTLLVATSPEIKFAADRMGLTARIEASGAIVAAGICFYQSYAGEMAEANGWKRLLTNSAKLVNIIGGYGYRPTLANLERCVDAAVAGRIV